MYLLSVMVSLATILVNGIWMIFSALVLLHTVFLILTPFEKITYLPTCNYLLRWQKYWYCNDILKIQWFSVCLPMIKCGLWRSGLQLTISFGSILHLYCNIQIVILISCYSEGIKDQMNCVRLNWKLWLIFCLWLQVVIVKLKIDKDRKRILERKARSRQVADKGKYTEESAAMET